MNLDIYDMLILLGLLAVVAGVWLVYLPAGLIVAGISLVAWSVLKDVSRAPEPEEPEEE